MRFEIGREFSMSWLIARRRILGGGKNGASRSISIVLFIICVAIFAAAFPALVAAQDEDPVAAAVALFNKGQDAHEKGDLESAVDLYQKALAVLPEFPEAEVQKGNALLSLGKLDAAETAFRRAVSLRPDWSLAMAILGSVLVRKGSDAEAETVLAKAISLDDRNSPAYVALTELRLNTKAKPDVLRDLLAKLAVLTNNARPPAALWAARGSIESALGDRGAAIKSFENALQLDPDNAYALAEKGSAALDAGDSARAAEVAKRLEKIAPAAVNTKILTARIAFSRGNADDAVRILDSIERPTPDVITLRDKILSSSLTNVTDLEKRLSANPSDPIVLEKLCSALRTQDPVKALEYCRKASEADPSNINYAVGFGAALVQAKRFDDAISLFKKLLKVAPENVTIHTNLATAFFQSKNYPEARTEYQWIVEKQPGLAIAYYFLGITHDHLEAYMDAMANYQLFLKMADPEKNKLEIDKVNLRLPALQDQIKKKGGKSK